MIEAVVQEKRRKAAQKTPETWSVRFGARFADHGYVVEQKLAMAPSDAEWPGSNAPALSRKSPGVIGIIPRPKQP